MNKLLGILLLPLYTDRARRSKRFSAGNLSRPQSGFACIGSYSTHYFRVHLR